MTDNTEPTIDKILRGVADGSYTSHWQDERLVLTVPEARQKIEALISDQVAKARIEGELEYATELTSCDSVLNDKYLMAQVMDRIEWCNEELAKLNGVKNK